MVLAMLPPAERRRVLRVVEARLHLTRGRGTELLLGRHPRELRLMPSTIVGVVASRPCLDAPLVSDAEPAHWLVLRAPLGQYQFVQTQPDSLVSALLHSSCTDFIALELARERVERVTAAGIRVWRADPRATLRHQIALFDTRVLRRWPPDGVAAGRAADGPGSGAGVDSSRRRAPGDRPRARGGARCGRAAPTRESPLRRTRS